MNSKLLYQLRKYKKMIIEETFEPVINEMLIDLKSILLSESKEIDFNLTVLETFHNMDNFNYIEKINELEDMLTEGSLSISNIKASFFNKHEKIIQRDKKWLSKNKNKILELNYDEIELEVLSDYKVTFEQLLNRHNIFDKLFVNSSDSENIGDKLRRFEDKNENLKNGLDNYFRTGTSRREIGLRKLKGEEAKMAVENMVAYCESFLAGKQFLEEKMNTIIVSISDASVKESLDPIEKLKLLLEADDTLKEISKTSKEISGLSSNKKVKEEAPIDKKANNSNEKIDDISKTSKELSSMTDKKQSKNEEAPVDKKSNNDNQVDEINDTSDDISDMADDTNTKEEVPEENNETEEEPKEERGIEDRQVGIAVLLTVAEERYFDYINILKGLIEE